MTLGLLCLLFHELWGSSWVYSKRKKCIVLGFCEVEGIKIPPLVCVKFIISFCKYGIIPPDGYGEYKTTGLRCKAKNLFKK